MVLVLVLMILAMILVNLVDDDTDNNLGRTCAMKNVKKKKIVQ